MNATQTILERIAAAGSDGRTAPELQKDLNIPQGTSTSRTSTLLKKGALRWAGIRRGRAKVYVLAGHASGKSTTPQQTTAWYEILVDTSSSMDEYNEAQRKCISIVPLVKAQLDIVKRGRTHGFHGPVTLALAVNNPYGFGAAGGTPLFRCTAMAIDRALQEVGPRVVLVFTDGLATDHFEVNDFLAALERANKAGDVTVAFMVPKGSKGELTKYGVPEGNIQEWGTVAEAKQAAEAAAKDFKKAVARGIRRTTTYFKADLSKIGPADLQRELLDVTDQVRKIPVAKEATIEDLALTKVDAYVEGTGFYEVMKREKRLPEGRRLLILNPATGRIYADGRQTVRGFLGYPLLECAIEPGNHAGYVVFAQSKSSKEKTFRARILPRGTSMVLWPGAVT